MSRAPRIFHLAASGVVADDETPTSRGNYDGGRSALLWQEMSANSIPLREWIDGAFQ